MDVGRFYAGIAALIWSPATDSYLLLRRSAEKDFGAGGWECVTGRVDQGESFEDALHREIHEELQAQVRIEFPIGTMHFYRGAEKPENELLGVVYCCALDDPESITVSAEHSEHRWVTAEQARDMLAALGPGTEWLRRIIERAERIRRLSPPELKYLFRTNGFELG